MEKLLEMMYNINLSRIRKYQCPFCSFTSFLQHTCEDHVPEMHPEWRSLVKPVGESGLLSAHPTTLLFSPARDMEEIVSPATTGDPPSPDNVEDIDEDLIPSSTPHLNPNWLKDTKKNIKSLVIEKCSCKVRESVAKNEKIQNIGKKKEVRKELIDETLSHVLNIFGGVGKPSIAEMRELVFELAFQYPALFKEDEGVGYGLGGGKGVSGLANQMLDKFRKRQLASKKKASEAGEDVVLPAPRTKGKKALIYGDL